MLSSSLWVPRKQAFTSPWAALGPTQYARSVLTDIRGILDTKGMIAQIFRLRLPATTPSCFRLEFHDATRGTENCQGDSTLRKSTLQTLFSKVCPVLVTNKSLESGGRQLDGKSLMRTAHLSPLHPHLTSLWSSERSVCPWNTPAF